MARVYSTQLAEVVGLGAGSTQIGLVPAGNVWVVRHATATFAANTALPLQGFTLKTGTDVALWIVGPLGVATVRPYDYSGRHVLVAGEGLYFDSGDPADWEIIVSGYQLTLP